jgi:hypothetical protein
MTFLEERVDGPLLSHSHGAEVIRAWENDGRLSSPGTARG